jgi:hypothetical protein
MGLEEFKKQKEIQEDIQRVFDDQKQLDEGIVRLDKNGIKNFLKKSETPEIKIEEPVLESEPEVVKEEPVKEDNQIPLESAVLQHLLDDYQNPTEPTKIKNTVTQPWVLPGGGENNTITNVGGGVEIYSDKYGSDLRLRTLSATGDVKVYQSGSVIVVSAGDYYTTEEFYNGVSARYFSATEAVFGGTDGQTVFESDGTMVLSGNATVWEDIRIPGSLAGTAASSPDYVSFVGGGLYGYGFDGGVTTEQVFFQIQMPHSWKIGTNIHPHVHWMPTTTATGTVAWYLEYTWTDGYNTFPAPTIISAISATEGQWKHQRTNLPAIDGSEISDISSMLICRLYRNPNADTYANDAGLLEFDIHYESDTLGSRLEFTK